VQRSPAHVLWPQLWNVQFLIYFGYMVCAGAVADWYFSEWESSSSSAHKKRGSAPGVRCVALRCAVRLPRGHARSAQALTDNPVRESAWRVLRYHVGTVALVRGRATRLIKRARAPVGDARMCAGLTHHRHHSVHSHRRQVH
jgi:hypothetical protein